MKRADLLEVHGRRELLMKRFYLAAIAQAAALPQAECATAEADYTTVSFYSADQKHIATDPRIRPVCVFQS
jgi:hypothetical protein